MRYLYGDSVPCQLQYNFLTTLDAFVSTAARALQIEHELDVMRAKHAAAAAARAKTLEELRGFHMTLLGGIRDARTKATTPQTAEFAAKVEDFAGRLVDDARRAAAGAGEGEAAREREEFDRRRSEVRTAVETFLISGRLPSLEAKVHMRLLDGHHEFSATFVNPHHITTSFSLNAGNVSTWRAPRKVADFARGIDITVGQRKSLFSRTMQPEVVHLDDFFFGAFDMSDDAAEIHLRKKVDAKDSIVFRLIRDDADLTCEVQRPSEPDGDLPSPLDSTDKVKLEQLWQLLRAGAGEVLQHKERLLTVKLDDKDLFEQGSVTAFFQRVMKLFGPIVTEIAKRSPNPQELSLKMEDESGRREEVYLKKQELLAKLAPLDPEVRSIFSALSLGKMEAPLIEIRAELPSVDVQLDES